MTTEQLLCPICLEYFDRDKGSGVYENLSLDVIGWEVCPKTACVAEVKRRNLERHKEWFPGEYDTEGEAAE